MGRDKEREAELLKEIEALVEENTRRREEIFGFSLSVRHAQLLQNKNYRISLPLESRKVNTKRGDAKKIPCEHTFVFAGEERLSVRFADYM